MENFYDQYKAEKNKTIAYEQTFNIVLNDLKLMSEMAQKNLSPDLYLKLVEHLISRILETLQKHIDK